MHFIVQEEQYLINEYIPQGIVKKETTELQLDDRSFIIYKLTNIATTQPLQNIFLTAIINCAIINCITAVEGAEIER